MEIIRAMGCGTILLAVALVVVLTGWAQLQTYSQ